IKALLCEGRKIPKPFRFILATKVLVEFNSGGRRLPKDDFTCSNGECVPKESRCDGGKGEHLRDCSDGSDEINCPILTRLCPSGKLLCGHKLKCYKAEQKMRRDLITADLTALTSKAGKNLQACSEGKTLCAGTAASPPQSMRRSFDCKDNSDESSSSTVCSSSQFQCRRQGICIDKAKRCDMRQDCMDNTDERTVQLAYRRRLHNQLDQLRQPAVHQPGEAVRAVSPVFRRQSHSIAQPVCANFVIPKFWLTTL
uniref:Low-density lipoprotein receptor domain class A n=1 Tax=Macrostomum lignano TaxID=282301 RepID=A0A1I8JL72_9PLAT